MALLPGLDYPTPVINGPLTIVDGQLAPAILFSLELSSAPNFIVEYSIVRGNISEIGSFQVAANGSISSGSADHSGTNLSGVTLSPMISGPDIQVQYTSTATGQGGQFWYSIQNITN